MARKKYKHESFVVERFFIFIFKKTVVEGLTKLDEDMENSRDRTLRFRATLPRRETSNKVVHVMC
jgi:hypothetical protein